MESISIVDTLKLLTQDLLEVDLSLITRDLEPVAKLDNIKDQYEQLSLLCRNKATIHPQWLLLSGRVKMKEIKRHIPEKFSETTHLLKAILHEGYYAFVMAHSEQLDSMIVDENDMEFNIFAVETMLQSYLARIRRDGSVTILETPQYMYLRVATYLWFTTSQNTDIIKESLANIQEVYHNLTNGNYSHASPTLFNAGMFRSQLASCFTLDIGDSMQSISDSWHDTAVISMNSGGIGIDFSSLRHSEIGQFGQTGGVVPWIKITDQILSSVDQCFHPKTIVYTINDGPKPISEIVPGDKLVRSDGTKGIVLRPIIHKLDKPTKTAFYSFEIKHYTQPIVVSEEHPFLAFKGQRKGISFKTIIKRLEKGDIVPEYIDVKDLDETSFVAIPIPVYEKDLARYTVNDCRMYGILLAGCIFNCDRNEIKVQFNSGHRAETIQFVERYLTENNISRWTNKEPNSDTGSIVWAARQLAFPFNKAMICSEDGEKRFHPPFLHLPNKKIEQIFLGLMEMNGTYRNSLDIYLDHTSSQVIESVRYMLLRMKAATSGYSVEGVTETQKQNYVLRIPKTQLICSILGRDDPSPFVNFFEYQGKIWSRVLKKDFLDEIDTDHVIDLEMEREDGVDENTSANYMTCIGTAHNGGKRKGSGTAYLCDWHIDIMEFIDLRKASGAEEMRARNIFLGLMISDEFMRRVENDEEWTLFCPNKARGLDVKWGLDFEMAYKSYEARVVQGKMPRYRKIRARDLWKAIIIAQIETGMPFILYKDAINRKSNQKNLGTIRLSNLCVSGDTHIMTDQGYIPIQNLENQTVNVWNGEEWSQTVVKKTGFGKDLVSVELSNGVKIDCTPEHRFYIDKHSEEPLEVEAVKLSEGDELIKYTLPHTVEFEYNEKFPHPYTHGFFCGVGIYTQYNEPIVLLYEEKCILLHHLRAISHCSRSGGKKIWASIIDNILPKFQVPMRASVIDRLEWFAGYADAEGTIEKDSGTENLQVVSSNKAFLLNVRLMLQTLGVDSRVTFDTNERKIILPGERDTEKEYNRKGLWLLTVPSTDLLHLRGLGFFPRILKFSDSESSYDTSEPTFVVSVKEGPRGVDTYCFTEPIRHMGMFNGVLTGQCTEITLFTDTNNIGSCNLGAICLDVCVTSDGSYDFDKLEKLTRGMVRNINRVIDRNYYPDDVPQIKATNLRNRPLGIGVLGLADVFALMDLPWTSQAARTLNEMIFETMYYAAVSESVELAKVFGSYETFEGSPASKGFFQFDLWDNEAMEIELSQQSTISAKDIKDYHRRGPATGRYDWDTLRCQMMEHGLRNSLLMALMPTASSANLLNKNECFEPYTQHVYARTVLSGQFVIINQHLVKDLQAINMWNTVVVRNLWANKGSIAEIPTDGLTEDQSSRLEFLKIKYKTVFEIPQKVLLDMALDRGRYVCQTQSFNCWMADPTYLKLNAFHFYGWKRGAKTGMYYLRQIAKTDPINFSLDSINIPTRRQTASRDVSSCNDDVCLVCQS